MASEFMGTQCAVEGHSVIITSWYDGHTRTWAASAPDYAYLFFGSVHVPIGFPSRQEAMNQVIRRLTDHFHDKRR